MEAWEYRGQLWLVARSSSSTVLTMNLKLDAAPPNELVLIAKNQMKRTIIRRT
jgi:hypothetical protein